MAFVVAVNGTFVAVNGLIFRPERGDLCQQSVHVRTIFPSHRRPHPARPFRSVEHRGKESVHDLESVLTSRDSGV